MEEKKDILQSLAKNLRSQALTCLLLPAALSPALSPGASQQHMPGSDPRPGGFHPGTSGMGFPRVVPKPYVPP